VSSVQSYEQILQELRNIKIQIEERVRPVAEHAVQAEVERLLGFYDERKKDLRNCLTQIDGDLLDFRNHLAQYDEMRSELALANERIKILGAQPLSLPEFPSPGRLVEMIVQQLQTHGDDKH
jgi:hypothetical protein